MFNNLLLKFVLFFIAGAVFMVGVLKVIPDSTERKVLGTNTTFDEAIHEKAWEQVGFWAESLAGSILPGLAKSPALKPVMQTKDDIEMTTNEVKNLPNAQKNAICKEICGN